MSENRKKNKTGKRVNNLLLVLLLITIVCTIGAFAVNIYKIAAKDTQDETVQTVETEKPENEFINDYYTIGHNATDINKEYFRELNKALDAGDHKAIAEAVAKCFVTEYYTWINKDGNYDIGGMQYIFTDDRKDFETYTRYGFYKDMDLYKTQIGTENLIEVAEAAVSSSEPSAYTLSDGTETEAYDVSVSWTYKSKGMSTEGVQNSATFKVVDHNGRWEIAAIN